MKTKLYNWTFVLLFLLVLSFSSFAFQPCLENNDCLSGECLLDVNIPCDEVVDCPFYTNISSMLELDFSFVRSCSQFGNEILTCGVYKAGDSSTSQTQLGICSNNPTYDKDKVDSFGFYSYYSNPHWYNSPGLTQQGILSGGPFSNSGSMFKDAWSLKQIKWSEGSKTNIILEEDRWFTGPDDEISSRGGIFKNFYSTIAESFKHKASDNYGGGLRLKAMSNCDVFGKCGGTIYRYTTYDELLGSLRTSGAIDVVPFKNAENVDERDLRRPSHTGGPYTSGGVIYNEVTERVLGSNGYSKYYYLTTDSTPENTNGAIDFFAADERTPNAILNPNYLGSARTVNTPWKRGLEYKMEYYSDDKTLGSKGLLLESLTNYKQHSNFKYYFGGVKLFGTENVYGVEISDYNSNVLNENAFGFHSGKLRVVDSIVRLYDVNSPAYTESIVSFSDFDTYSGKSKTITTFNFENTKQDIILFAHEDSDLNLINKNMFSFVKLSSVRVPKIEEPEKECSGTHLDCSIYNDDSETCLITSGCSYMVFSEVPTCYSTVGFNSCEDITSENYCESIGCNWDYIDQEEYQEWIDSGLTKDVIYSASQIEYDNVDGRIYPVKFYSWNDSNKNNDIDSGEWILLSEVKEYDNFGNIVRSVDQDGIIEFTKYDNTYYRPSQGWYYSPFFNWTKTYNTYGLINSSTSELDKTLIYNYDFNLRRNAISLENNKPHVLKNYGYYKTTEFTIPYEQTEKIVLQVNLRSTDFYDGLGNVIQKSVDLTDDLTSVWIYEYDLAGRKIKESMPFNIERSPGQSHSYLTILPSDVKFVEFEYYSGPLNRIKKKIFPDGSSVQYVYSVVEYNGLNHPAILVKDEENKVTRYTYDALGELVRVEQDFQGNLADLGFET